MTVRNGFPRFLMEVSIVPAWEREIASIVLERTLECVVAVIIRWEQTPAYSNFSWRVHL